MIIGAVLCARNESHIIDEWVAHYLSLGMERIHVLDHVSTDDTRRKLDRIHERYPGVTVETWDPDSDVQRRAMNRGLAMMTEEQVDWCAFVDADEFIGNSAPASSETLADLLGRHSTHCAVGLHWAIYGSSGHVEQPSGLLQEEFLYRAIDNFTPHHLVKSVVRPRYTMGAHNPHGFSLDHPYYTVSGQEIVWGRADPGGIPLPSHIYTSNEPELTGWRVNHYFCQWRSRWDAKVARSKVRGLEATKRSEVHWAHHDRNEVFDPSALRWTARDKEILASFGEVD